MTTATEGRVSLKHSIDGNERVAAVYAALITRRSTVPNMFKVWAHSAPLLETVAPLTWALLADGALAGFYKELIATRISMIEGCEYAVKAHAKLALAKGATPEQVAALDGPQQGPFNEQDKLGFVYAERILRGPAAVDDELFAEVKSKFTEAEIVELTAVATAMLFLTRFISTLQIPLTPPPGTAGGRP